MFGMYFEVDISSCFYFIFLEVDIFSGFVTLCAARLLTSTNR